MGDHDMNGWGWAMMSIWMVLLLGVIGVVFWWVATSNGRAAASIGGGEDSARGILDRRLARGEIGIDEHERALGAINKRDEK